MTAACSVVDASGGNATASVEVAVYALPSVTAIADRTSAEPGTPITFTATPTGGSGGFSYNWGFGDRSSGDGAVVAHTYTDAGQYTAIVTTRDSAGGVAANTVTVTISSPTSPPAPLAAHAFAGSTATQVGIAVSFACMARDGTQPYEFAWDFGDETGGEGAAIAHEYGLPGTKTATCTVTDAGGNRATFSVVVEIYSVPTVAASVDRPNAGPGTEVTFKATASYSYSKAGTYTPTVTVTDAYGASAEKVLPIITVRGPIATVQPASSSPDLTVLVVWGVLVIAASAAVALAILRRRQRRA